MRTRSPGIRCVPRVVGNQTEYIWTGVACGRTATYTTRDRNVDLRAVPVYTPSLIGVKLMNKDGQDRLVYAQNIVQRSRQEDVAAGIYKRWEALQEHIRLHGLTPELAAFLGAEPLSAKPKKTPVVVTKDGALLVTPEQVAGLAEAMFGYAYPERIWSFSSEATKGDWGHAMRVALEAMGIAVILPGEKKR